MFRTFLIVLATVLAGGAVLLGRQIPVKADMKRPTEVLIGLGFFFMLFFAVIRFVDNYFWWSVPAVAFIAVNYYGLRRLDEITGLIHREQPDKWLADLLASGAMPVTGTTKEGEMHDPVDYDEPYNYDGDLLFGDMEEPAHRFMDEFVIADEADLGPNELELERLDDFIFTSRHGYLVHDHDADRAPCDVMTILPGMSIADLIDAAKLHECAKETA